MGRSALEPSHGRQGMGRYLKHPFWQAVLILGISYLVFEFGIAYLPPFVGIRSAPVPNSVVLQFMLTVLVGVLLYVSENEERWRRFKQPIRAVLVEPDRRAARLVLLLAVPALVGFITFDRVRPKVSAPPGLRSIHPAPPAQITFRGRTIQLTSLKNPLRADGSIAEDYEVGKRIYYRNCVACHGDALAGDGHYARGFNPQPLSFRDSGTIPQLTESFVFWRIAKGGPGLPREGTPWNSAMPAWEDLLTEEEIWAVIIFLYEQTGWSPRTWEETSEASEAATAPAATGAGAARRGGGGATAQDPAPQAPGRAVYDKWCAGCHGESGKGDGPAAAYMLPRPRDFTRALYQIRTTASGALPTDADIRHVIEEGMPGTAMPGWKARLSSAERDALVQYVKSFSPFFKSMAAPEPLAFGKAPRATPETLAEGQKLYESVECWKCHGREGRGDGPSAPTLRDDFDFPIRAADLTESWTFNGGGSVEDIYRRLRTGLDGTPMPSFSDLIDAGVLTEQQLWYLAQYVRSLAPKAAPPVREVVRAALVEGELPANPGDGAWAQVERFYIPLVGQIIVKPRWFAPTVDGVWVQALHDGESLAVRLTWHDPSRSPDSAWLEWQAAVLGVMEPREGDTLEVAPRADAIAVQFPRRVPQGMERPYFLMGDAHEPVYLWYWRSEPEGAIEALARGLGTVEPLSGTPSLASSAVFRHGEWSIVLRRPLATPDTTDRLQLPLGEAVPMALFAWDGSNGEAGRRGAVSTWYYLYLDRATPASVFVAPAVAMVLTGALGVLVAARAQRRERREPGDV